ncbi:MAG TPA: metallopeptidase TldD-related protein [Bryobacteraceae bacterium]
MTARVLFIAAGAAAAALLLLSQAGVAQDAGQNGSQILATLPVDDDVVLKAMRDEMQRSRQLRVAGGEDAPYFFSYDMTDSEDFHVVATLGSAVSVSRRHARNPGAEVRVGSYVFDNTGHIYTGRYSGSRYDGNWPIDDNYSLLREGYWLLTDRTFKAAEESIGRKRASLKNTAATTEALPDFSKADAVVSLPKVAHKKIDDAALTQRIAKLSSVFGSYPEVLSSIVELQVIDGITDLLNSEGTAIRYSDKVNWVIARAEGQAADGMVIRDAASIQALDVDKLPGDADLRKQISDVAEHVRDLSKAPMGEAYTGPVLFEPEAAAQLLAQMVGDNLYVPRKPLFDPGGRVNFLPSEFETKVGSRVLPDWMDVTDDPSQTVWNGKPLVGYYQFDIEGVPPKPVAVIEKGVLKNFLMTRQPIKGFATSNGHARLLGSYGASRAAIGNMLVKTSQSTPLADLKKRLIEMTQQQSKPYGLLVRKLNYPYVGTATDLQVLAQASAQSGGSPRPLSPPVLIYKVFPDGHEELVRGLRFRGVSTRSLRDILAASQETALFEFVNNSAPLAFLGEGGYVAATSVVSPGLLFEEMELETPQEPLQKRAIVPPPGQ